ncbi:MAG TPA: RNA polymerase sigma factor [Longimicrobium sp.]
MQRDTRESFQVLRAQAGDRAAFEALLAGVQAPLHGFVTSVVGDRALADDVLQEVFVRIWRKLRWLREPALFRPWAFRIAARAAMRHARRERRLRERWADDAALEHAPAPEPPERIDPALAARLRESMAAVSPASRAVLDLHYLQELTLAETAAVLGISAGTAKSRLAYGLRALRRALDAGPTSIERGTP